MVYIEPAPYILDLIRVMRAQHPELQLRVLFISAGLSQQWNNSIDDGVSVLLPVRRIAALKQILAEVRKGDFDWLHLAGWGHPLLMAALICGALFKCRISMESDTQLPVVQAGWKWRIKELFYPHLFARVDLLLPGGSRQQDYFRHYRVPKSKIRIARMTVDVSKINKLATKIKTRRNEIRLSMGLSKETVVFVFVGRLEEYKGINMLLDAFFTLNSTNVQLLVVGEGKCRPSVEKAAKIDSRIVFVGRKPHPGVVEAFAISDVAIVPSTFEPWGLVVNEAMAVGLPVIASERVGCIDDLVRDEMNGLLFPAHDVAALASAMQRIAGSSFLREQMGETGNKLISNWRLEDEVAIITSAWREVLVV